MVEKGEDLLSEMGLGQLRVRILGETALIELEENEITRFMNEDVRSTVATHFHSAGFNRIVLDLEGYRCGSMNPNPDKQDR